MQKNNPETQTTHFTSNDNVDAATACRRYRESLTPMMLHRFEKNFMAVFGATPPHAVPAEEAKRIYEQTLAECGT